MGFTLMGEGLEFLPYFVLAMNEVGRVGWGAAALLQTIPNDHHVAVISFNDEAAFGALRAARRLNREGFLVRSDRFSGLTSAR
jgi:DNA-binding LacI/PurR family transcriptional regulator